MNNVPLPSVDRAWVDRFLRETRAYGVLGSMRKDGSPHAIPLGYVWDGTYFYLSMRTGRGGISRLRNHPFLSYLVADQGYPPNWVALHGRAEEIADPDNRISIKMMRQYKGHVANLDLETFEKTWLSTGRVVFRILPERIYAAAGSWLTQSA